MAYTSPATWTGGQLVGASDLNTQIRDNLLFLAGTTGVLPSLHATTFTVDSGGLTVTAGNIGIGTAASTNAGLTVFGTYTAIASAAYGVIVEGTVTASANSDSLMGLQVTTAWNTNGHSTVTCFAMQVNGGTATGALNAYALYINPPTGASNSNIGILCNGSVVVSSGGLGVTAGGITISAGGLTISAGNTNYGPGEFTGSAGSSGMTTGFIWIPAANAAPSGTPTAGFTGRAPMYYDSNLKRFNIWDGSWRGVTLS